jgi:hypothetical protein
MMIDAWATARQIQEDTGLSPQQISKLSMAEYARLSGRQTPAEAAVAALDARYEASARQVPQEPPAPSETVPQRSQGITDAEFLAWRQSRVSGGENTGIFGSSAVSRSPEFAAGVRRHAGRGALSSANVQEPPRLEGRYLNEAQPVQGRQGFYH